MRFVLRGIYSFNVKESPHIRIASYAISAFDSWQQRNYTFAFIRLGVNWNIDGSRCQIITIEMKCSRYLLRFFPHHWHIQKVYWKSSTAAVEATVMEATATVVDEQKNVDIYSTGVICWKFNFSIQNMKITAASGWFDIVQFN